MSTLVSPLPPAPAGEPMLSSHETRRAALYDFVHPWALDLAPFVPVIVAELKTRQRPVLVELGCGTGHLALQVMRDVPDLTYWGFDDSSAMLQRLTTHARTTAAHVTLKGPIDLSRKVSSTMLTQAPKADVVLMTRFLQTIPLMVPSADYFTRADVLRLARQMVRPGGRLILIEDIYGSSAEEHRAQQDAWDEAISDGVATRADWLRQTLPSLAPELLPMLDRNDRIGMVKAVRNALDRGAERQPLPWASWQFLLGQLQLRYRPYHHPTLPSLWLLSVDA